MAAQGGFDHNSHGLRLVTELERRYADFDGLNLTQETLEGLVKHNGPMTDREGRPLERWRTRGVPVAILAYDRLQSLHLDQYASLEAQAAGIADDIAYDAHDIDDGLRAELFDLAAIRAVPFVAALLDEIDRRHPGLERPRVIHELTRRVITRFIEDVIAESSARVAAAGATSLEDVQRAGKALVSFSPAMAKVDADIKSFLFANMYRHPQVKRVRERADGVVRGLFSAYVADPAAMPPDWAAKAGPGEGARAHAAADYIAGMTDRFALNEYRRLFDPAANLR
jgi:dGTPase